MASTEQTDERAAVDLAIAGYLAALGDELGRPAAEARRLADAAAFALAQTDALEERFRDSEQAVRLVRSSPHAVLALRELAGLLARLSGSGGTPAGRELDVAALNAALGRVQALERSVEALARTVLAGRPGIALGLADVAAGRTRDAADVERELRARFDRPP